MQAETTGKSRCNPRWFTTGGWVVAFCLCAGLGAAPPVSADCIQAPNGLVAWWAGDGNADDIFGANNGTLIGNATANANGKVGLAFSFDGTNGYAQVPDSPALRPSNFTIETWVNFKSLDSSGTANAGHQYLVFKRNPVGSVEWDAFSLGKDRYPNITNRSGDVLYFIVAPTSGPYAEVDSHITVATNVWYHVAGVRGPDYIQLYVNGQLQGQATVTFPQEYAVGSPLCFGTSGQPAFDGKLKGLLDEVSLYNRALASNEIAGIYLAGTAGKCKGLEFMAQPQSQWTMPGSNALFTVSAWAEQHPSYQWQFNGNDLAGATATNLALNNVQITNAGDYTVVISNASGMLTSAVATLTVMVPSGCAPTPDGLVGWWPGDGDAKDIQGTNNGVLQSGATANAPGVAGSAFGFDGASAYVQMADSPVFHPTNLSIEAWVRFNSLDSAGNANAGHQIIVFKQNTSPTEWEGFSLGKDRQPSINPNGDILYFNVASADGVLAEADSQTTVATNVWYHMVGVRGPDYVQLYVNGHLEAQVNVNFPQDYSSQPLYFGTTGQSAWDGKFSGWLDEVSLYNRALAPIEIATLYVAGADAKCKAVSMPGPPQDSTAVAGSNALLSVAAKGKAPLAYQWFFNDRPVPGATASDLVLTNVQPTNAGNYTVSVANSLSAMTSAVAMLTVLVPPAISQPPQSLTVMTGSNASFSVTATGTAPLSYQWQFGGAPIADAISTNLTLSVVDPTNAGDYAVVVANAAGAVTSAVATLAVLVPPAITLPPQSMTLVAGSNASFSVTATGTLPMAYQWQFGGVPVADATSTNLVLVAVNPTNAGDYAVVVSNVAGVVTSTLATLTVLVPPAITAAPQSMTIVAGSNASFSVTATGTAPLSYQWRFNGTNLDGELAATLLLTNAQPEQSGSYSVTVSNVAGMTSSPLAMLTVLRRPLLLGAEIVSNQVLRLTISGDAGQTYGIQCCSELASSNVWLSLANITMSAATNVWSDPQPATLPQRYYRLVFGGVFLPPTITSQPTNQTVSAGSAASFSVLATGFPPLTYQWLFNGTNLDGATAAMLMLLTAQPGQAGNYAVVVADHAGLATSKVAALTVVATRPLLSSAHFDTNGGFSYTLAGDAGCVYLVESSTNLHDWAPAVTLTNALGQVEFVEPVCPSCYSRFYRARTAY